MYSTSFTSIRKLHKDLLNKTDEENALISIGSIRLQQLENQMKTNSSGDTKGERSNQRSNCEILCTRNSSSNEQDLQPTRRFLLPFSLFPFDFWSSIIVFFQQNWKMSKFIFFVDLFSITVFPFFSLALSKINFEIFYWSSTLFDLLFYKSFFLLFSFNKSKNEFRHWVD